MPSGLRIICWRSASGRGLTIPVLDPGQADTSQAAGRPWARPAYCANLVARPGGYIWVTEAYHRGVFNFTLPSFVGRRGALRPDEGELKALAGPGDSSPAMLQRA